uniref:DUF4440 domain-containing protein n=1 Tax=Nocardia cyriacigeorgica TaxID=135487 RepID=UPI0024550588
MNADLRDAVIDLHADLAEWLGSAASDSVFERFASAQHDSFSMVTTSGEKLRREELLAGLRGARNAQSDLRIDITEFEILTEKSDLAVVRFLGSPPHPRATTHTRGSARQVTAGMAIYD